MPPADQVSNGPASERGTLARLASLWLAAPRRWSTVVVSVGLVAGVALVAAAAGPIHARIFGHDVFFLLDNGWRAFNGQRVHADYASGWGPVTFLIVAGGMAVSGGSVASISYGSAFVAAVTGVWAAWLSAARTRSLTVIVFPLFVALMAAASFPIGVHPTLSSHAMVYNRYGFALLAIVMLVSLQPGVGSLSRRRILGEACLTGCAVAILLFLKVTYFLAALPPLALSIWLWGLRRDRLVAFLAGAGAISLLFAAYLRFDVLAMLNDLRDAAGARTESVGLRDNLFSFIGALSIILLVIPAAGCAWLEPEQERGLGPRPAVWVPLATAIAVVLDIAFLLTNAQPNSYPVMTTFAALLLFPIDALLRSRVHRRRATVLLVAAVATITPWTAAEGYGLALSTIEARFRPVEADVVRFDIPRLRSLVLHDFPGMDRFNGRNYVKHLNDGVRLLQAQTSASDRIATLEIFEPFSYALGRPPIRGGIAAAANHYTLSKEYHPSPDRFFADADVVMVPKVTLGQDVFYDGYNRLYMPAIEQRFVVAAESAFWRLYRRRGRSPAGN